MAAKGARSLDIKEDLRQSPRGRGNVHGCCLMHLQYPSPGLLAFSLVDLLSPKNPKALALVGRNNAGGAT